MSHSAPPAYVADEPVQPPCSSHATASGWTNPEATEPFLKESTTPLPNNVAYTRDRFHNILCSDHSLEDPDHLWAFLRHYGSKPPEVKLRIKGTHWEEPESTSSTGSNKKEKKLVTDFKFQIRLTPQILVRRNKNTPPYFYTHSPDTKTFRGSTRMRRQEDEDESERMEAGLGVGEHAIAQYLASRRPLKVFTLTKVVNGWDMGKLKKQIQDIIRETGYTGDTAVWLSTRENYIGVRPHKWFSRIYNHPVTFFLRCLLFPIGLIFLLADYLFLGAYWQIICAEFKLYSYNPRTREERGMSRDQFFNKFGSLIAAQAKARAKNVNLGWGSTD